MWRDAYVACKTAEKDGPRAALSDTISKVPRNRVLAIWRSRNSGKCLRGNLVFI